MHAPPQLQKVEEGMLRPYGGFVLYARLLASGETSERLRRKTLSETSFRRVEMSTKCWCCAERTQPLLEHDYFAWSGCAHGHSVLHV